MAITSLRWDMILGGFGLFMFGISFMGDGLKAVAGDKLRDYIDKYTTNPLSAAFIGICITIVMQSSSASTAITIGLVRAGLMSLEQAAGIVVGANIGSTVTSFLVSLSVDRYAMHFIFLGGVMIAFGKRRKTKYFGNVILGFGLIFFGLSAMGDALSSLKDLPEFTQIAADMARNPILAMLTGALLTAAVQASSATIGVVQKMYEAGALPLMAVLPFVFGANIGTTITGALAAIGGTTAAKRTAGIHTLFNVIGTVLGMLLLRPLASLIQMFSMQIGLRPMMQIAVTHILFNTATAVAFFILLKQMTAIIRKIIPGNEPERKDINVDELDPMLGKQVPSIALAAGAQTILQMFDAVDMAIVETQHFLNHPMNKEGFESLKQNESLINSYDKKITDYMVRVSTSSNLNAEEMEDFRLHLEVIKNLERLGDLGMNLGEFFEMVHEDRETFSDAAMKDINAMFEVLLEMLDMSKKVYIYRDALLNEELLKKENKIDKLEFTARQAHFERMAKNDCGSAIASSVYCDILGNLERMGDHCCNIARSTLDNRSKEEDV